MEKMILQLVDIDKHFGVVHALKSVSLSIREGEIMGLVGENGAGKSTLMKILTGAYSKDAGEIIFDGGVVDIANTVAAKKLGIAQVYQHAELVPELTVAENVYLGDPAFGMRGRISWDRLYDTTQALMDRYRLPIDARRRVKTLSVANRQLVTIVKALKSDPKLLILDEPTAVLSDYEVSILFDIIEDLKKEKRSLIYISHRLEEIFKVSSRIAVMRDGVMVNVLYNEGLTEEDLIANMLGKNVSSMFPKQHKSIKKEVVLEAKGLTTDSVEDVSFKLYRGEMLGIAGLVGSGRTELARAIYGLDKIRSGSLMVEGKKVKGYSPKEMLKHGLFLAPEDRKGEALVLTRSIKENVTISNFGKYSRMSWMNRKKEVEDTGMYRELLKIKAPTIDTIVQNLSGGNQQKVVVAKALATDPKIVIFDEPTQGIDVGSKAEIYALLNRLKEGGMSIIFISSEMGELQAMCSRLLVMRGGRLVGEIDDEIEDNEKILRLMYRSVV